MGFCLRKLFASEPDRVEDVFWCAVGDACVVEEFESFVGEGCKEEVIPSAVIAFDVSASGEDSEADVSFRQVEGVFVGVVVEHCGEEVLIVEGDVSFELLVEFLR